MKRDKPRERKIADERIRILMALAESEALKGRTKRTERYVSLAKRIGTRYNVRFPRALRRKLCKQCDALLLAGVNCRVRLTGKAVSIHCFKCGGRTRIPYTRERKERRKRRTGPE